MMRNFFYTALFFISFSCNAQTAGNLVQIYLQQNNITASPGDFQTCHIPTIVPPIAGVFDSVCQWNTTHLGAHPSNATLSALIPAYQAQQVAISNAAAATAQYKAQLNLGLIISCAQDATICTSAITGTYGIQPTDQFDIASNRLSILADGDQANGQAIIPWIDTSGTPHIFTLQQFTEFSIAAKIYITSMKLSLATLSAGGSATFPSNTITLQ